MWNKYTKKIKKLWKVDAYYLRTITDGLSIVWKKLTRFAHPIRPYVFDFSILSFILVLSAYMLFPTMANADIEQEQSHPDTAVVAMTIAKMQNDSLHFGRLVLSEDAAPRRFYTIPVTAYTSEVGQTDDSPCITASGMDVCARDTENIVAANFLPIGTRVRIPEFYGDRIFYVEDRMNARYSYHLDVWMKEKSEAKTFGIKRTTIEVF